MKVAVAVLGSPSLISLMVSVPGRKATLNQCLSLSLALGDNTFSSCRLF